MTERAFRRLQVQLARQIRHLASELFRAQYEQGITEGTEPIRQGIEALRERRPPRTG